MGKNDGGPAFPHVWLEDGKLSQLATGLSLRDYFAAAALPGALELAHSRALAQAGFDQIASNGMAAAIAYDIADAMLIARARG